jgi:hypothetical protein
MKSWSGLSARALLAAACVLSAACTSGSSSPSGPSDPGNSGGGAVVVRNGVTEQAVSAQVSPSSARVGDRVSVSASGYLTREQLLEAGDIFLWPGDTNYIREIAYWEFTDNSLRTLRWTGGFTITPEGDLANDASVLAKAREVAAEASRRIGFPVNVGAGGAVTIGLDPGLGDQDAVAEARLQSQGSVINGARIVFITREEIFNGPRASYTNTFLHELGHVIGLGHSPDVNDVMTPAEGPGTFQQVYTTNEAATLHMIYAHRRPGNVYPDRDPGVSAASLAQPRYLVIRD